MYQRIGVEPNESFPVRSPLDEYNALKKKKTELEEQGLEGASIDVFNEWGRLSTECNDILKRFEASPQFQDLFPKHQEKLRTRPDNTGGNRYQLRENSLLLLFEATKGFSDRITDELLERMYEFK